MYFEIEQDVLDMAESIIDRHHRELAQARIGFVFKDKASKSGGRTILGQCSKVGDKQKAAGLDLDYIITLAHDYWIVMNPTQKAALIDHELCHCDYDDVEEVAGIRGHDVEEFREIIERYGLWRQDLVEIAPAFQRAVQMGLPDMPQREGGVVAVKAEALA